MSFSLTGKSNSTKLIDDAAAEAQAAALVAKYQRIIDGEDQTENRSLPAGFERFPSGHFTVRASSANGKRTLRGYAARFGRLSENLGGFREALARGCFTRSLRARPDVLMFKGHDPNAILARCSNGTLSVSEDDEGLAFEAELQDTVAGRDIYTDVKSRNLSGMSFGMVVRSDDWGDCAPDDPDNCDSRGRPLRKRTVLDCDLFEISPVSMPAYPHTEVNARALWPLGPPQSMPLEIRSFLIGAGAPGQLTEEEKELRTRMRIEAIRATL